MNLFNICKRVLDILIAITVMVILSPVLVAIWITIKLSSKGPVIFKQERAGKNSKPFVFYKFRTMKRDVEPFGPARNPARTPA